MIKLKKKKKLGTKPLKKLKLKAPAAPLEQKKFEFPEEAKFETVDRQKPAETIRNIARGFRINFSGFGQEKKVDKKEKGELLSSLTARQQEQMKVTKRLFDSHPALKKLSKARGAVRKYFHAKTMAFPEDAVRILIIDMPENYDKLTADELDAHFGREANAFREEVRKIIARHHDAAVAELVNAWPEVLAKAQAKLEGQFRPEEYPTAEAVARMCQCRFEPYNVEMSKDWKYLSESERKHEIGVIQERFEAVIAKQEDFVIKLLDDALKGMVESLSNYSEKKTTKFKSSVVRKVFDSIEEFKKKTVRYGILKDSAVEKVFRKVKNLLTDGGTDKKTLPDMLRKSDQRRDDLLDNAKKLSSTLQAMIATGEVRRKIIRDE